MTCADSWTDQKGRTMSATQWSGVLSKEKLIGRPFLSSQTNVIRRQKKKNIQSEEWQYTAQVWSADYSHDTSCNVDIVQPYKAFQRLAAVAEHMPTSTASLHVLDCHNLPAPTVVIAYGPSTLGTFALDCFHIQLAVNVKEIVWRAHVEP